MKANFKLSLCLWAMVILVGDPFVDFASGGTHSALLRVNSGIHATLATDCTLYAAANGNDSNDGTKHVDGTIHPKTLTGAAAATVPGSVVCLLGGRYELSCTFNVPNSGTSSAWIAYKSYGDGDALIVWMGGFTCGDYPMIKIDSTGATGRPTNYLQFIGLTLDGLGTALDGFSCRSNHDLHFYNNTISNTGGAGIQTVDCNYVISDHNIIHHNGYVLPGSPGGYSWTSGISYNNNTCNDTYTGFHFVAANNIIVGEVDQSQMIQPPPRLTPTDGNGVTVDIDQACATPPSALVVNNVVYGNGGRCFIANSAASVWVVNNTCYRNDLDTLQPGIGSLTTSNSNNVFFVNNISVSWQTTNPPFDKRNTNTNITYAQNLYWGGPCYADPSPGTDFCSGNSNFIPKDPQFVGPLPYFDGAAAGQFKTSRPPSVLTPVNNASSGCTGSVPACDIAGPFAVVSTSPAYNQGIDPATLTADQNIKWDLATWVYKDISGKTRTAGVNWDLGALAH